MVEREFQVGDKVRWRQSRFRDEKIHTVTSIGYGDSNVYLRLDGARSGYDAVCFEFVEPGEGPW